MITWLDHKIFGNGRGLGSPYFDSKFYWLGGTRGEFYTFMQGLGAQLHSFQWRHPLAGERRELFGYKFAVLWRKRHKQNNRLSLRLRHQRRRQCREPKLLPNNAS